MDSTNMLANTVDTVAKARKLGATIVYAPITFTDDYHELSPSPYGILKGVVDSKSFRKGSWGAEMVDVLKPQPQDIVVEGKRGLCGFASTNLDFVLRSRGITNIALGGFLTNCCVGSTMRTGYEKGYNVVTLTDCTATVSEEEQRLSVEKNYPTSITTLMKYKKLGRTGLFVSEICLGTMTFGGRGEIWPIIGQLDQAAANNLLRLSVDAGINFVDTADVYSEGESERILGRAVKDLGIARRDLVIATKVQGRTGPGPNAVGLSRGHIIDAVKDSLTRLGTDYIDLYQIHGADLVTPLDETLRALDDLVRAGHVRHIGCSNLMAWQIMKALGVSAGRGWARFETVQAARRIRGARGAGVAAPSEERHERHHRRQDGGAARRQHRGR
jgi:ureidoacrylate peracid hydrolase